ncbi:hypothetical protein BH23VER1_BH23VER1_26300 [soil metagenome]
MIAPSPVLPAPEHEPAPSVSQGLSETSNAALQDRLWGEVFLIVMPALCFLQLALYAWLQKLYPAPTQPAALTAMTVLVAAYSAYRLAPVWRRIRKAEAGHPAVWLVEESLAAAKDQGAVIFGDLPGQSERHINHLIVAPTGVFVVCVRSSLRGRNGRQRVRIVREEGIDRLTVSGLPVFDDPGFCLTEAAAGLSRTIQSRCGEKHDVRPVIVFPGAEVTPAPLPSPYLIMSDDTFHRELCLGPDIISSGSISRIGKELAKARGSR